jgi:SAM-dependent methyltransferase
MIMLIINWTHARVAPIPNPMGTAKEQGEIWGARSGDWWRCSEPAWNGVFGEVLDGAGVRQGTSYLDLGCGAGGALVLARERGASVTGLDASENLVAIARERLPGSEVAVGDMEELPFASGSFDAVSAINSFQFTGNVANSISEAARVSRKGGTVTALVWGPREQSDLLSAIMPAVFAHLPPSPPGVQAPVPLGTEGVLEALMEGAGLHSPQAISFSSDLNFPDLTTGVRACLSASARAIRHAGEAAVRDSLEMAMAPFVVEDGKVRLKNVFRMVTARR